ncbi:hypothetical protein ACFL6C_06890 [Myxococcota bacterium]
MMNPPYATHITTGRDKNLTGFGEVNSGNVTEYVPWRADGTADLECERVLVYPNVIRDHDLYAFVTGNNVTHLMAPKRRQWLRADLRPAEGWRLLR